MDRTEHADGLATSLIHAIKTLQALRHTMPRHHPAVDPLSYPVLFRLLAGPMRVGDLASVLYTDISTVSRQASALQTHGLLDKVADPDDGRAQLLSLSAEGHALLRRVRVERARMFTELLEDWEEGDIARFTTYLDRLTLTLEQRHLPMTTTIPKPTPPEALR